MLTITEAEAREKKLPGCDVFKRTQLAYKDDLNRDGFVVSLYHESYKIFLTSVLIGQFPTLREESRKVQDALDNGTFDIRNSQISKTQWQRMEYINLENFYIATGFELFFKSKLLENDFLVNVLEDKNEFKELRKDQRERPIHKNELFNISGYFYDASLQKNILKGITEKSLDFSLISKVKYYETLNLSTDLLGIIEDYRKLRNQIHLPGDFEESPNLNRLGDKVVPLMIDFINREIADKANMLTDKWGLNYRELSRINV
ncbi:hypothetical protein [Haliscomenobacter hydrossis]|uniref:Uncharacterized protein n=1 Tax=Haliscomenobacter hydrossis (strain ATCC 27775 / DSM 1100 / LMG 10767 / O) TaxID=760192 RepID=F4KYP5_HALH1|nr:hypothetical protein [Haliscomenobacter hydrossis]AEE50451.1 hypothetical protein Halhy_2581 [Haliscomenobacter hydrossis DSM 1100]